MNHTLQSYLSDNDFYKVVKTAIITEPNLGMGIEHRSPKYLAKQEVRTYTHGAKFKTIHVYDRIAKKLIAKAELTLTHKTIFCVSSIGTTSSRLAVETIGEKLGYNNLSKYNYD